MVLPLGQEQTTAVELKVPWEHLTYLKTLTDLYMLHRHSQAGSYQVAEPLQRCVSLQTHLVPSQLLSGGQTVVMGQAQTSLLLLKSGQ